jgi:ABC-type uncharacterized transport system YnjBCD substrate-binding protein
MLRILLDAGCGDQIMLSHDKAMKSITKDDITAMRVTNPGWALGRPAVD